MACVAFKVDQDPQMKSEAYLKVKHSYGIFLWQLLSEGKSGCCSNISLALIKKCVVCIEQRASPDILTLFPEAGRSSHWVVAAFLQRSLNSGRGK